MLGRAKKGKKKGKGGGRVTPKGTKPTFALPPSGGGGPEFKLPGL
jgi:hypothetical protein